VAAEAGLAVAHELGAYLLAPAAHAVLASVALRRGELAAAGHQVERYQAQLAADQVTFGSARYTWIEAQLADAEDGPEAAVQVLAGIYDGLPARRRLLVEEPAAAAFMVRAALSAGDRPRARAAARAARQLAADNPGFPTLAAAAAHARGLLEGDPDMLLGAAGGHRHAWARASAAEDAGVLLAADESRHRARGPFEEAIAGYQEAGAEHDAGRVRSRLRDIGVRRRHWKVVERPVCGWASLTDTERMVAEVVAEGLTNRKVADRLFLSPHTVDFHLRQIFRKLDIRSRVELARIVLERDGDDHDDMPVPVDVRFVRQKTSVAG
jgi:DNA-binding CsgD family transcriptional regulator